MAGRKKLFPCSVCCFLHFYRRNMVFLAKFHNQLSGQHFFVSKSKERIHKVDIELRELFHIVFDVFCVGGNHRAVVVVACLRCLVALVRNARIEDIAHTLTDQPGNMAVHQLCRVALRLTRDGLDAKLIDLSSGLRRKDDTEAQFL